MKKILYAIAFVLMYANASNAQTSDTLRVCIDTKAKSATIDWLSDQFIPQTDTLKNDDYIGFLKQQIDDEQNEKPNIITLDVCDPDTDVDKIFKKREGYIRICKALGISTTDEKGKPKKKAQLTKEIKAYCEKQ